MIAAVGHGLALSPSFAAVGHRLALSSSFAVVGYGLALANSNGAFRFQLLRFRGDARLKNYQNPYFSLVFSMIFALGRSWSVLGGLLHCVFDFIYWFVCDSGAIVL